MRKKKLIIKVILSLLALLVISFSCFLLILQDSTETPIMAVRDPCGIMITQKGDTLDTVNEDGNYRIEVVFLDKNGAVSEDEVKLIVWHRNNYLEPGDSDEEVSVEAITDEHGMITGCIISGNCHLTGKSVLDIRAVNDQDQIIHQIELDISFDEQYHFFTDSVFQYDPSMTTSQLLEATLSQNISSRAISASSREALYIFCRNGLGGFSLLEDREDAVEVLIHCYERYLNGEQLYSHEWYGHTYDSTGYCELMLSNQVYWEKATWSQKIWLCILNPNVFQMDMY